MPEYSTGKPIGSWAEMERLGMPPNYLVRLKIEQANVRKADPARVSHPECKFIPSVFVLAESLAAFVVFLLFFTQTEGSPGSFVLFAFITVHHVHFRFLYTVRLIRALDKPFHKGHGSQDDVSLCLLQEFEDELQAKTEGFERTLRKPRAIPWREADGSHRPFASGEVLG